MRISKPIQEGRIRIRNYESTDLAFVTDMWFDEENGKYLSDPTRDYVDEAFQRALDDLADSKLGYYFVIERIDTGERIGSACAFPDETRKTYDIGYCIHKAHWNRGYGTQAVTLLLQWLQEIGACAVTAEVAIENAASCALLRRLGFAVEKKTEFQKYHMDIRFASYLYRKTLPPLCCDSSPAGEKEEIMPIETPRLRIRAFAPEDADDLQEILGDAETMQHSEPPYSQEKTTAFLTDFCIGQGGAVAAVHRESNKLIGYLLFHAACEGVYEMGWFFNRRYWQQGYAYEACQAVIDHAFGQRNVHKIFAETTDAVKSVGLMQKLGMHLEGIQRSQVRESSGNWADLYCYGLLEEDWRKSQRR